MVKTIENKEIKHTKQNQKKNKHKHKKRKTKK